ncbi:osmotin-like protein [Alnus glutinosa]|uniref:osmotin-like protein n=1 Tax=Alnus glutinosa TaxID=3517 RepID=UPI002D77B5DF|nr:osmotin-like protein [Alnus glutinosa]
MQTQHLLAHLNSHKMVSTLFFTATFLVLCTLSTATHPARLILTLVNKCPFTVWPAINPDLGHAVLERGGFVLDTQTTLSFPAPTHHWSGQIWARTGCTHRTHANKIFTCATGDCGGRLHCGRIGSSTPTTRAHLRLQGYNNLSSYGVSLAEGFNVPMTVTAHEADKGRCPVVGCSANLLQTCPEKLQLRSPQGHGPVVACKSGCEAFGRNHLACMSSKYSEFFRSACPATFTYAHGQPSLMHDCSSPRMLEITFCH